MTTNTTEKNEIETIVELIAETKLSRLETAMKVRELLTQLNANRTAEMEDVIIMADELESECDKDGDKGTKQWMAFKGFRNTIRDKYINRI
jgi:hypothetical protein